MKTKIPFWIFACLLSTQFTFGQNQLKGDVTGVWGAFTYMSSNAGSSYSYTYTSDGGAKYFRLGTDWSGEQRYHGVDGANQLLTLANDNSLNISASDYSNAYYINTTAGYNYVFKTKNGDGRVASNLIVFEIQGTVRTITTTSRIPVNIVYKTADVKVTATLNGNLPTGQGIYLRYTTDNWTTSTIQEMSVSGTTCTATLYGSTVNSNLRDVAYYFFSSGSGLAISHANADYYTINLFNNGGANYTYSVQDSKRTSHSGNWSDPTVWSGNTLPISSDNLVLSHDVTIDTDPTVASLTIRESIALTSENGQARNLTIGSGGEFANLSSFTPNDGKITFSAMNTVSGTLTFNDVDITSNYVDFGASSTINGILKMNPGSSVLNGPPTYGSSSTLIYRSNGTRTVGTEWTAGQSSGQGVPQNVQISAGTTTNISFQFDGAFERVARGNFTLDASQTCFLSSSSGGNLNVKGNFVINGTLNCATPYDREIIFSGSSLQSVNSGGTTIPKITINNTGSGVQLASDLTISKMLTMTQGNIDCNSHYLYISNSVTDDGSSNGISRTAGIIFNTSGYLVKRSTGQNTGHYLFPIGSSTLYSPIDVNFTSASITIVDLTADVSLADGSTSITSVYDAGGYEINKRSNSYWRINKSGGQNGEIQLSITTPYTSGINSSSSLRIMTDGGTALVGTHADGSDYTAKRNISLNSSSIVANYYIGSNSGDNPLPVQLISFTGTYADEKVLLNWQTATEVNNYGFNVESRIENGEWKTLGFVNGNGNSNSPKNYSFKDAIPPAGKALYRLKQIDFDGKYEYSQEVEVFFESPSKYTLSQNYPNPFNPSTTISYSIPSNGHVSVKIYDVLGKEISTLVNEENNAGFYNVKFNASKLSSGVYICRISHKGLNKSIKLLLLK